VALTVRAADAADAPFLLEMLVEAAFWRPEGPRGDAHEVLADPELAHYVSGWPRPGDLGVIAEDEEPVGAAWLRFFPGSEPGYGFVDDATPELGMGVRADHRGRGVGTKLLADLLSRARTAGIARVSLSVEPDNFARHLYEHAGFIPIGRTGGSVTMLWTAPSRPPSPRVGHWLVRSAASSVRKGWSGRVDAGYEPAASRTGGEAWTAKRLPPEPLAA
jgi:GNAT superfamily N-acetyltransferase